MIRSPLRTLPALVLLAFSSLASASAFQRWEQNASGLGVAYAGSAAVVDNASAQYFNPASLSQLQGIQVSLGLGSAAQRYKFRANGGASAGDAGERLIMPNAYLSWQLSPSLTAGFGISRPFALSTEYKADWLGNASAIKSDLQTINYNPSLAYKLNDRVALGFGLNYQTIDSELTQTGLRIKADDASLGWNAGALFTLSPAMRVGLSYRSGIEHRLEGRADGVTPVRAKVDLPDTFTLSVWQQVSDRWEAMGDLSYTRWDSMDRVRVSNRNTGALVLNEVANYDNAWRIAWGAAYKASDAARYKFGIAYEKSPVNTRDRSARLPDNDRLWLSLGAQWKTPQYGMFDLGYAYIYMKDARINTPAGKYDASEHLFGVQYSLGF